MKRFLLILISFFTVVAGCSQTIKWHTFTEALELNKIEPRKIVVDVYTDWCGWCKVMEKNTYNNKIIAEYLSKKFYIVRLDAEQKEDVKIGNKTYKFVAQGRRGYHELAAVLLQGNMVYPSVVFLDEKVRIIQSFQGYIRAKPFDQIIKFIGENHYITKSWNEFIASYESQITE
jgi:thioredoxin-related protein